MTDFLKEVGTTEVTQILGEMEIYTNQIKKFWPSQMGRRGKLIFKNYIAQPKFKILIKMKQLIN